MKTRTVLFVIVLNSLVVALEIFFGFLSSSMSLIADATHNLGDVAAVIVTFVALVFGAKAATGKMTFGFLRSEMMAAFVNALCLVATMIYVLFEAAARLLNPAEVEAITVIAVAAAALVANGISAYLLKGAGVAHSHDHSHRDHAHNDHDHSHDKHDSDDHKDLNVHSAYLHMLSDALISLGVIIGAVAVHICGVNQIDSLLAIVFSLWIMYEAFKVLKKSFFSLMDMNVKELANFETALLEAAEVESIHDLHLYQPSSKTCFFSAHLVLRENLTLEQIEALLERLRHTLEQLGVTHAIFQPETAKYAQTSALCAAHGEHSDHHDHAHEKHDDHGDHAHEKHDEHHAHHHH